jgi:ABC-type multidrug transport system ATPase subunit
VKQREDVSTSMVDTHNRGVADSDGETTVDRLDREPVMRLRNVTRHFGRGTKRRTVLHDISLEVPPGTMTQVGGRNGAGKTTLLRVMTGILAPNEGDIVIGELGAESSWREFYRRIGFLSAGDRGLYARLSVRDHFEYWCALAFVPRAERRPRIEEALGAFGLLDLADRRSERLSQGQRQRLRLALALVHQPQVVLLDEPRNSLDSEGLELLAAGVHAAINRNAGVVWCSPPGEVQPVDFDRRFVLESGVLTAT